MLFFMYCATLLNEYHEENSDVWIEVLLVRLGFWQGSVRVSMLIYCLDQLSVGLLQIFKYM